MIMKTMYQSFLYLFQHIHGIIYLKVKDNNSKYINPIVLFLLNPGLLVNQSIVTAMFF